MGANAQFVAVLEAGQGSINLCYVGLVEEVELRYESKRQTSVVLSLASNCWMITSHRRMDYASSFSLSSRQVHVPSCGVE